MFTSFVCFRAKEAVGGRSVERPHDAFHTFALPSTGELTCILRRRMIPESSMARGRLRTCRRLSRFPGEGAGTGQSVSF